MRSSTSCSAPGEPVFNEMVEAFGPEIVGPDGELDRPKVASIAFADEEKRKQLNGIVHPAVGKVVLEKLGSAGENDIVVIDIPLMTETSRAERGSAGHHRRRCHARNAGRARDGAWRQL